MATRTAVIGAGAMGKGHLRSLASVPSAEVVALVDPNEETLASVAAENGVPSTYTDVASMLAAEQPEYAIVASPVLYHAEQSIAAFEAGAHVLCEKPLSMNMVEAEAIVEAARRAQRLFTMGFQLRQSRAYRALKEFIDEGRLGEVYHARVWAGHIMAYPWGRYHHRKEYSFGGVMAATVVHILDAALWVLGSPEPVAVSASTFRRLDRIPDPPIDFKGTPDDVTVEDFGHAHVRFADGSSMSIEGNWLMHPCGHSTGFEIHGVLGLARDNGAGVELERKKEIVEEKLVQEEEPADRTAAEHGEFIAAIEGNGEPMVRFRQALGVQRILVGIYESAQAGAEVKV